MNSRRTNKAKMVSRRAFLKSSAVAGAALAWPTIVPSSVFGANAPSNRITMGCIGMGNQGIPNMRGFLSTPGTQVVAVCDVNTASYGYRKASQYLGREPARKIVNEHYAEKTRSGQYHDCDAYNDFRDLLARDDIDAVLITTPDHWHASMAIAALKAGKDVYCEKPLTLTIAQGRALCDAVKRYDRILQTGSHQRSDNKFRFGCELVRNGRIGKLHTIRVKIYGNNVTCPDSWQAIPVPEGFDYGMWLGPAPWQPYAKQRCLYSFRFILDYSGGQMTNWGAHFFDIAQWGNGTDHTGPVEIVGRGEFPRKGLFNTATKVHIEYTYADGVKLICETGSTSVKFEGSDGWILLSRGRVDAHPKSLVESAIGPNEIHLYRSNDHKKDFLNCVRLRKDPIANVEIGHRSATICHLGNIAMLLGRKLNWDPDNERFVNDPEADNMLSRGMRPPWHL